jgi:hypothetical protein
MDLSEGAESAVRQSQITDRNGTLPRYIKGRIRNLCKTFQKNINIEFACHRFSNYVGQQSRKLGQPLDRSAVIGRRYKSVWPLLAPMNINVGETNASGFLLIEVSMPTFYGLSFSLHSDSGRD